MPLVVMKFGGSSVSDIKKIKHVARLIIDKKQSNNKIIVVVSAPGDKTDELVEMAYSITKEPSLRAMDMLLATGEIISISLLEIVLHSLGENVIALTGPKAGIIATNEYTNAKIISIDTQKVINNIKKHNIVIVAGFQALNTEGNITTLGRGGSDLTAVALAAVLKVDYCEIYSDVDGIYTTDPRIIKEAKKINCISYDEMLEMSSTGAQVLQVRSVAIAKRYNIDIYAKGTFSNNCGTLITSDNQLRRINMEGLSISSITFDKDQAHFIIMNNENVLQCTNNILSTLSQNNVNIDMIDILVKPVNTIAFTVKKDDVKKTNIELKQMLPKMCNIIFDQHVAKISIIGIGLKNNTNLLAQIFEILYKENIDIAMVSSSEIRISFLVKEVNINKAINSLHTNLVYKK
ncbi:MAG: aspartate kinase [Endomicrobium sp.]|jgi:aspartate kinase|nr:aspartate kinase [Endomicrobium sp.]